MTDDLLILGGGPAGLTAGMYAARARMAVRLFERGVSGGQINDTATVENYPGLGPVAGTELGRLMEEQAVSFGLEIERQPIVRVGRAPDGFLLTGESGSQFSCKSLILAMGASPSKLGIPGEQELVGKGVSYCAVCDGPFYKDREVAVVGGGDSAVEESLYLTKFADRVHLIHRRDELRAIKALQEKAFAEPKIEIHWSCVPEAVLGEYGVEAIRIKSVKDGSVVDLPVYGVFFYVGLRPNLIDGLEDLVDMDPRGFIITGEDMACKTPGLFAAGDIRAKTLRQISTAVGDGATAAYRAQQFLEGH